MKPLPCAKRFGELRWPTQKREWPSLEPVGAEPVCRVCVYVGSEW